MTIDQAKVLLNNFRPNGMDSEDSDFAEALQLAAQNRELGEWLANERLMDDQFANALKSIEIPSSLKDEILASIEGAVEMHDDPELDAFFQQAITSIKPPQGLKDQILVAMDKESDLATKNKIIPIWKVLPLAAAAVVALSVILIIPKFSDKKTIVLGDKVELTVPHTDPIKSFDIQRNVGRKLISNNIQLVSNNYSDSIKWLKKERLPTFELSSKLKDMTCVGCSKIVIAEGVEASIVRFITVDNKEVNLLVIAENLVADIEELSAIQDIESRDSYFCPECKYWIARMKSEGSVVIILSKLDKQETTEIF